MTPNISENVSTWLVNWSLVSNTPPPLAWLPPRQTKQFPAAQYFRSGIGSVPAHSSVISS
jgi:hypothetical protein